MNLVLRANSGKIAYWIKSCASKDPPLASVGVSSEVVGGKGPADSPGSLVEGGPH